MDSFLDFQVPLRMETMRSRLEYLWDGMFGPYYPILTWAKPMRKI